MAGSTLAGHLPEDFEMPKISLTVERFRLGSFDRTRSSGETYTRHFVNLTGLTSAGNKVEAVLYGDGAQQLDRELSRATPAGMEISEMRFVVELTGEYGVSRYQPKDGGPVRTRPVFQIDQNGGYALLTGPSQELHRARASAASVFVLAASLKRDGNVDAALNALQVFVGAFARIQAQEETLAADEALEASSAHVVASDTEVLPQQALTDDAPLSFAAAPDAEPDALPAVTPEPPTVEPPTAALAMETEDGVSIQTDAAVSVSTANEGVSEVPVAAVDPDVQNAAEEADEGMASEALQVDGPADLALDAMESPVAVAPLPEQEHAVADEVSSEGPPPNGAAEPVVETVDATVDAIPEAIAAAEEPIVAQIVQDKPLVPPAKRVLSFGRTSSIAQDAQSYTLPDEDPEAAAARDYDLPALATVVEATEPAMVATPIAPVRSAFGIRRPSPLIRPAPTGGQAAEPSSSVPMAGTFGRR
jgi:hypothetical protein